jgi:AhpD family alkylhydroperoxidase
VSGPVTRRALRRSLDQIRYVTPVSPAAATGLVETVYAQVERGFGMLAPPVALHSPAPEVLAACWLMLRETLLASGQASRAAKETVAAAVSAANACPYCVTVHGAAIRSLGPEAAVVGLAAWARDGGQQAHLACYGDAIPGEQLAELAGVAVTFHYLNRMVNVFLGDSPLPSAVPGALAGPLMWILGRVMLSGDLTGTGHHLLPAGELPGELAWLARSPRIADAFARAGTAVARAGLDTVPTGVRDLLLAELADWDGAARGRGRAWVDAAVSGLAAADRPAGRLALLTAFASYQVLALDVADFRHGRPDDEALIGLTSWASFAAAQRVGGRLGPAAGDSLTVAAEEAE